MPNYSHFDNTAPCGGQGLYVGAAGSEVQVASATGALYQSGTAIPTFPAGSPNGSNRLFAYGNATLHSESATIATGLTTVGAAGACLRHDDLHDLSGSLDIALLAVEYTSGNLKIGGLILKGIDSAGTRRFRISDTATECSVDWWAFGV